MKIIIICIFATMIYDIIQAIFGIATVQIPGITVQLRLTAKIFFHVFQVNENLI